MRKSSLASIVVVGLSGWTLAQAANQPPVASFVVTPAQAAIGQSFSVDASGSTDDHTAVSKLLVRWDWENDGTWDTAYTTVKTATHAYPGVGQKTIALQVQDQQGATGTTTRVVQVIPLVGRLSVGPTSREPDVDINPTSSTNIVVSVATSGGSGLNISDPAFFTQNSGASWTQSVGHDSNRCADPGIEFTPGGTAVLMSLDDTACDGNLQGMQIDLSTNGGAEFQRAGYAFHENTLFLLPDGSSRAVCGKRANYPCMQPSDFDDLFFDYPKIASDKGLASPYSGNLYAIAHNVPFDQDGDAVCESHYTVFARSTDGGGSWTSAQALSTLGFTSALGVGADGTVYHAAATNGAPCPASKGIALKRSIDGGATFGAPTCAYNASGDLTPVRTWPAADPSSAARVYVVFDAAAASLGGSVHVYAIRSTDGGNTWSAPVRIDAVLPGDVVDHYRPSLSVSSSGRLDVAWFDYRNSSPTRAIANGQLADVYYAYSLDFGVTWSANLRLSPVSQGALYGGFNDFLTVTSAGTRAYVAYSLSSTGAPADYQATLGTLDFQ
ncbi:MAG TPA: PKD domain-containing protein [Patescibacteria group bacterium]|nr:PKD domain-containing protein [Patescibacteria group bacterium]